MLHPVTKCYQVSEQTHFIFCFTRLNRDAKQNLEMDWSDKKEAHEIDTACFNLRNGHTNKQFHPGAARYQEIQSTPESWAQVCLICHNIPQVTCFFHQNLDQYGNNISD